MMPIVYRQLENNSELATRNLNFSLTEFERPMIITPDSV